MKHRISAGLIVERNEHVLLVHCYSKGVFDFWVAPGGGVKADESLHEAASREALEETGLIIKPERLIYIEEIMDADTRYCKFWHTGIHQGGEVNVTHPEALAEGIVEVAWMSRSDMQLANVFPPMLAQQYWEDKALGFPVVKQIPLRKMHV